MVLWQSEFYSLFMNWESQFKGTLILIHTFCALQVSVLEAVRAVEARAADLPPPPMLHSQPARPWQDNPLFGKFVDTAVLRDRFAPPVWSPRVATKAPAAMACAQENERPRRSSALRDLFEQSEDPRRRSPSASPRYLPQLSDSIMRSDDTGRFSAWTALNLDESEEEQRETRIASMRPAWAQQRKQRQPQHTHHALLDTCPLPSRVALDSSVAAASVRARLLLQRAGSEASRRSSGGSLSVLSDAQLMSYLGLPTPA